jgi:hypothetical protein
VADAPDPNAPSPKPAPAPWGPPAGIVAGLILFALLKDLPLVVRILIVFASIALLTWISLLVARRR